MTTGLEFFFFYELILFLCLIVFGVWSGFMLLILKSILDEKDMVEYVFLPNPVLAMRKDIP